MQKHFAASPFLKDTPLLILKILYDPVPHTNCPTMASAVGDDDEEMESFQAVEPHMSLSVIRRLYVSHFLSTWNTRVFEFGAVLYLASIFPDNLLPLSTYALVRGISAILLSPAVGQYIDTSDRLKVVKISIGKCLGLLHLLCKLLIWMC